jgi:ferritin-like metal-binding protein YciE
MSETPTRDAKLVALLNEAFIKEQQLESALEAHIPMAIRDDYAKRLKDHLKETKSHATQVSRRIKQLGGDPQTASLARPEGLSKAADSVSGVVEKARAAARDPRHALEGTGEQEKMLRNVRSEYQEEAYEIATYTVIESLAMAVGDKQTAKVARDILRQEQRMQEFLAALLPELSIDVAHDEIPVSEIQGEAERGSKPKTKTKTTKVTTKTKAKAKA